MTEYVVIEDFTDAQDDRHIYREGDKFPRKGRAKKVRVEELLSSDNKRGMPLIAVVEESEG